MTNEEILKEFGEKFGDRYNNISGNIPIVATGTSLIELWNFILTVVEKARKEGRKEGAQQVKNDIVEMTKKKLGDYSCGEHKKLKDWLDTFTITKHE